MINHFDWIAGTSTGAILALALADGVELRNCLRLYLRLKDDIFVTKKSDEESSTILKPTRPYSADSIELFLKTQFGANRCLGQIKKNIKYYT